DVQTVFAQMSAAAQPLLSHDDLSLGLISPDGQSVKMHASSAGPFSEPREFRLDSDRGPSYFQESLHWDFYLVRDFTLLSDDRVRALRWTPGTRSLPTVDFTADPYFMRLYKTGRLRSVLRVPVRLQGAVVAVLVFSPRRPNVYGEEDVEVATRI